MFIYRPGLTRPNLLLCTYSYEYYIYRRSLADFQTQVEAASCRLQGLDGFRSAVRNDASGGTPLLLSRIGPPAAEHPALPHATRTGRSNLFCAAARFHLSWAVAP